MEGKVVGSTSAEKNDDSENGEISSKLQTDNAPLLTMREGLAFEGEVATKTSEEMENALLEMESKYAAYVRHDTYGTMGTGDIHVWEKALLVVALLILVPVKVLLIFIILVTYYIICRLCTLCGTHDHKIKDESNESSISPLHHDHGAEQNDGLDHVSSDVMKLSRKKEDLYVDLSGLRRAIVVHSGRFFSRAILFVLGFYWIIVTRKGHLSKDGKDTEDMDLRPGAIVSNHVSYVDILYHMSASFPSFVAKRSVGRIPLIGLISKCLGCVYVQREDKGSDFKGVAGVVSSRLHAASSDKDAPLMLLFPEGTTTNGSYLLPFKTGAFVAGTAVQPVILKYTYHRFSPAWDTISGVCNTRNKVLLLRMGKLLGKLPFRSMLGMWFCCFANSSTTWKWSGFPSMFRPRRRKLIQSCMQAM